MNERSVKLRLIYIMMFNKIKENFKNKNNYYFINYLVKIFNNKINLKINFKKKENVLIIHVDNNNLLYLINFLKNHYIFQFKTLVTITAVDYPEKINRFEINYFLLSLFLNLRLCIKIFINKLALIQSSTTIFNSAN